MEELLEMIECKVEEETKPEPRFKVGDKITNGTVTFTILTLASDRYFVEDNFGGYDTLYFKTRDDWKLVEEKTSIKLTGKAIKNDEYIITTNEQLFEPSNISLEKEMEWNLPEGYQFVDENGNVINATKIVLEKKKKEVILSQEQIDTMVHESCVLFCKYCGCGVPRETCTSLGTCKDHDEYRKSMRTYLENHKK